MTSKSKTADRIAETAFRLFGEHGYENVTIKQICESAGLSRSSFYSYFRSKNEIIIYRMEDIKRNFSVGQLSFLSVDNDFERMWVILDQFLSWIIDLGPNLTKAFFMQEIEMPCGFFDALDMFNDVFARLIKNCQRSGIIRNSAPPDELVKVGIDMVIALSLRWCAAGGYPQFREDVRRRTEVLYDVSSESRRF